MPIWRFFVRKIKETRGEAGGTPLPEAIASDDVFKDMGTVEKLAENFKANSAKTFIDYLPAEAKSDPSITKYKTGEDLFKGHKNLVEMIGKKGVTLPAEGASEDEVNKFYNSMGRPEKSDAYQFAKVENLHPEVAVTAEAEKGMKDILHKVGLSNKQADALNTLYLTRMSEALVKRDQENEQSKKETQTVLQREWGNKYPENLALANRLVKVFGGDNVIAALGDLGGNPDVLKFLSSIGRKLSEDSINNVGGVDLLADAGTAKNKIVELNKKIMDMKQSDPGYHDLIQEVSRLYKIAYPG
jgi:hypothetical protein